MRGCRFFGPGADGVTWLQTRRGNFVTALGGGGKPTEAFHTDAIAADAWEYFYVLKCGDLGDGYYYAIRPVDTGFVPGGGNNPRFISATGGGGRIQNAMTSNTSVGAWEMFNLEKQSNGTYALRTASRNFVTAVGNGGIAHPTPSSDTLHTDATRLQTWEQFRTEERSPGVYGIQTRGVGSGSAWIRSSRRSRRGSTPPRTRVRSATPRCSSS
jgi:hypothetical protein